VESTRLEPAISNQKSRIPVESQRYAYIAAIFAAVGGLLFGYDTGVISGALIFIKKSFGLSIFEQGLVVSVVLVGAAVTAISGGSLSDRFGRRKMLLITSLIFIAGAVVCCAAGSDPVLIVGRLVVGAGIGLASSVVPLYISEIAPADARGWQVSLFQLAVTVGILVAYITDYTLAASGNWRWMLGLAVVPGAMLGAGMLYLFCCLTNLSDASRSTRPELDFLAVRIACARRLALLLLPCAGDERPHSGRNRRHLAEEALAEPNQRPFPGSYALGNLWKVVNIALGSGHIWTDRRAMAAYCDYSGTEESLFIGGLKQMTVQRGFKNMNIFGLAEGFSRPRLGKQILVSLLRSALLFAIWPQSLLAHQDAQAPPQA